MNIQLQKIMYEKNLTVRQVSMITKAPCSTISDICNGAMPKMDTMEKLAAGLKIRIEDLYESPYK